MGISGLVRSNLKLLLEWIPITIGVGALLFGFGRGCLGASDTEPAETIVVSTTPVTTVVSVTTVAPAEAVMEWLLVYVRDDDYEYNVAAVSPDGSDWHFLVGAGAYGALFSPDGTSVAFGRDGDVQILDLDELTTRTVTSGAWLGAWSPDGKQIAVVDLAEEEVYHEEYDYWFRPAVGLALVDVATGYSRPLPGKEKITFVSGRDGDREVFVMNADGSGVQQLTDNYDNDSGPDWSPDGNKIAFVRADFDAELFVMNADGSGVQQLTDNYDNDRGPDWSPDGNKIAFVRDRDGDREVFVMNADGSGVQQLTDNYDWDGGPDWSPDGNKIAFVSDRDGDHEVFVMNADGSGVQQLTDNYDWDGRPDWSPDGNKIAFVSDRDGDHEVFVMNADGNEVVSLDQGAVDLDWGVVPANQFGAYFRSPDFEPGGEAIAFHQQTWDGGGEIHRVNLDGSGAEGLGPGDMPAFSPDGSKILYEIDLNVSDGIGVMESDGTRIAGGTGEWSDSGPVWSPDGQSYAFTRSNSNYVSEVWIKDLTQLSAVERPTGIVGEVTDWGFASLGHAPTMAAPTTVAPATTTTLCKDVGSVVGTYPVGDAPYDLVFDGTHIWVSNSGDATVSKLLATTGALVGRYPVGSTPTHLLFDGTHIWVSNSGDETLSKLRASDGVLVGTYPVGDAPNDLVFDGTHIWVSNVFAASVSKLRASDGVLVGTYPVGKYPSHLVFDGTHIWVSNSGDATVSKLLAATGALVGRYPVGSNPMHLLFDGTHIWVYNQEDLTLSKLRASDGVLVSTYSTRTLRPGNLPMPTAVGSDGIHIWLAQNGVDGLVMLRISDGVVEGTYPWWSESALPTHGRVVFGAAYVWTSNWYENTVVKSRTVGLC